MYLTFQVTPSLTLAIFVFDTRVTEQRSRMIKRGKSCKEKGRERCEVFNTKMDFKTEMRTDLYLQKKIKRNLFQTSSVSRSNISHS